MLPSPIQYHIYTGELPQARPYAYVLAGDGLWKVANTRHLRVSLHLSLAQVAGLAHYPEEGLLLRAPRIPVSRLAAVYEHARRAGAGVISRPIEQMYHFHWWQDEQWRVALPRQSASAVQVSYAGGYEASVVMDLHSHHAMGAQFSSIDNNDEQGCRLYAVIGRLYTRPEIRVRVGIYGDFMEIDPLLVFDGLGPFVEAG